MILKDFRDQPNGSTFMWAIFDTSDLFIALSHATTSDTDPPRLFTGVDGLRLLERKFRGIGGKLGQAIESRVADRMLSGEWQGDLYRTRDGKRYYGDYYFLPSPSFPTGKIGLFQTRRSAYRTADNQQLKDVQMQVFYHSWYGLKAFAEEHPAARIDMRYPELHGIAFADTYQYMKLLPDNVFIWRLQTNEVNV